MAKIGGIGGGAGALIRKASPFFGRLLKEGQPASGTLSTEEMANDDAELVRGAATWAIILEMQGLPEEVLVRHLNRLGKTLSDSKLDNEAEYQRVLEYITQELDKDLT